MTHLESMCVYAIPMRSIVNGKIISTFPPEVLMKVDIKVSQLWDNKYSKYKYNFKKLEDIEKYIKNCEEAAAIPNITDTTFYEKLLEKNKDQFGSLKQLEQRQNKLNR